MSAVGTAAISTTKTYLAIGCVLAAVGGTAMAVNGMSWIGKTAGTGVGASLSSVDDATKAFKDTMEQGKADDAPTETTPKK